MVRSALTSERCHPLVLPKTDFNSIVYRLGCAAIPAGYTPPAGWKPGDGCPAMLPDHWFTSQPDDEVAPADPIPEASLSSGALR